MKAFVFVDYELDYSVMIYADDETQAYQKLADHCTETQKNISKFDIFPIDKIIGV